MGFKIGDTITGSGNYDTNAEVGSLYAMRGQKLGDWQYEEIVLARNSEPADREGFTGASSTTQRRRYIDTQWGRVYDNQLDERNRLESAGDLYDEQGRQRQGPGGGAVQFGLGRYANEHGSDGIIGNIDENGVFTGASMDRESNAEMNTWLAIMATFGVGAYAAGGAAVAGAGGSAAAGGTAAAAGLSAAEIAQLALAAGALASGGKGGGGGSTSAGPAGETGIEGPTAPPAPPIIDYQDLEAPFRAQNKEATKNRTNLNPTGITNALYASGGLLLGA